MVPFRIMTSGREEGSDLGIRLSDTQKRNAGEKTMRAVRVDFPAERAEEPGPVSAGYGYGRRDLAARTLFVG